jgi:hypothetical protein
VGEGSCQAGYSKNPSFCTCLPLFICKMLFFLYIFIYLISRSNSTEGCHVKFSMSCVIRYKGMPSAIYNIKSFVFLNIFTYDNINIFSTFHPNVCKYADLLTFL